MSTPHPDIGALYIRHREPMHAVANSVLRDSAFAGSVEDVVMETISSVIANPPKEQVDNWEAYLVRATRNKAIDLIRSAAARHAGGPIEGHQHPATDQYIADDVAQRIDAVEDGALLWDKLAVLDPRDRQILWQYKALGRPRDEVAREFNITPSRVSQVSTKAMTTLHIELSKEGLHR